MAVTAFPVLARLLAEKDMLGTRVGMLALTCAAIDDVIAWCLLATVVALIHARGLTSLLLTIGLTILFIGFMLGILRPLLAYVDRSIQSKQVLVALSIILLLLSAYATNAIGIHPVFGAFLMGIILPRRTVFIEQVRSLVPCGDPRSNIEYADVVATARKSDGCQRIGARWLAVTEHARAEGQQRRDDQNTHH